MVLDKGGRGGSAGSGCRFAQRCQVVRTAAGELVVLRGLGERARVDQECDQLLTSPERLVLALCARELHKECTARLGCKHEPIAVAIHDHGGLSMLDTQVSSLI